VIVAAPEGWQPGQRVSIHDLTCRMITVREQARAQRIPDDYVLHGTAEQALLQAGKAVPVNVPPRPFSDARSGGRSSLGSVSGGGVRESNQTHQGSADLGCR
jgi:hypothetical protein